MLSIVLKKKYFLHLKRKRSKERRTKKATIQGIYSYLPIYIYSIFYLFYLFLFIHVLIASYYHFFFPKLSLLNCCFLNVNKKGNLKILQNLDFSFETSKFEVQYFFSKEPNRHYAFMLRKLNVRCIRAWDLSYG